MPRSGTRKGDQEVDAEVKKQVAVGTRARFFHPRTLGVMHRGCVVKVHDNGEVSVKFDVDGRVWRTHADCIAEE